MTDTPLTAEVERAITDRLMAHIPTDPDDFPEFCQRVRAQFEGKDATIAALTTRAEQAEAEVTRLTTTGVRADERREMQKAVAEAQAAEERTKRAEARVAELEAAGKLLATQGREMATGLCSDTREVGATGVCVACQVRMVRYLEVWRAALEGKR